ncbi:MAG: ROK family protein [bacterium]
MSEQKYRLGIDIGGTKMAAVLIDADNKAVTDSQLATPKDDLNHFIIMIKALLEPLQEKATEDKAIISSLGIGVPAPVDYENQKILTADNLNIISNLKLIERIQEQIKLDMPMKLDNDVNCFVRGEAILGAGKDINNVYGITIGTGIGGGWWFNKQIYTGAHGGAGEICDMLIDLDNKITLEQAYQKLTQNNPKILAQEAYEGDQLAEKSFEELGEYLGMAFANIVNILDPGIIIVGGGATASSDLFLNTAKKTMAKYITTEEARKIKIVKSKLKQNAGAIGAALLFK